MGDGNGLRDRNEFGTDEKRGIGEMKREYISLSTSSNDLYHSFLLHRVKTLTQGFVCIIEKGFASACVSIINDG